jgi:hypothetical protein
LSANTLVGILAGALALLVVLGVQRVLSRGKKAGASNTNG